MERRRIKNIIILVLLLVNGFLLVLVGMRRDEVRRYEQSALEQAVQVMERNGIQVTKENLAPISDLSAQATQRSTVREEAMVSGLLGEAVAGENQGGGLYTYQGSCGQVSIRAGGEISAAMEENERWRAANPKDHAAQILNEMQIDGQLIREDLSDEGGTVTFRQLWQGSPLFSCQVVFTYQEGYLVALAGSLLATEEASAEKQEVLSLPTGMLRFLDEILASGDVCSAVTSMQPGYRMTQSFTGAVRLNPAWLISSNTADYYMDAVTGQLSRAPGE